MHNIETVKEHNSYSIYVQEVNYTNTSIRHRSNTCIILALGHIQIQLHGTKQNTKYKRGNKHMNP